MNFLKTKIWKKSVSILLLMGFLIQLPNITLANEIDGIFLPISSAKKLASEHYQLKKESIDNKIIINNIKQQNKNLEDIASKCSEKSDLLIKDKEILKVRGDKFELNYAECEKNLTKCKNESPSRLTWFGIGVLTATIIVILGMFSIK